MPPRSQPFSKRTAFGPFGVPRDGERAFELYMLAAQQGNAYAQCCVGICYAVVWASNRTMSRPCTGTGRAARRGSAQAQCNVGYSYEIGRRPLRNRCEKPTVGIDAQRYAISTLAQYSLGLSYLNGESYRRTRSWRTGGLPEPPNKVVHQPRWRSGTPTKLGRGVAVSLPKAVELYEAAAKAGDAQGQHNLANMYLEGSGVEKDLTEAVRWCRKAAEQGLAVAQDNLATRYMDGSGVEKDLTEAVRWRRKAAEQGLANAQYNLALDVHERSWF